MLHVNPNTIKIAKAIEYLCRLKNISYNTLECNIRLYIDGEEHLTLLKIFNENHIQSSIFLSLINYNGEKCLFSLYAVSKIDTNQSNVCMVSSETMDVSLFRRNNFQYYEKCGGDVITDIDFSSLDEGQYFQYSTVYDMVPWEHFSKFKTYTNAIYNSIEPHGCDYFCELKFTEPSLMTEKEVHLDLLSGDAINLFKSNFLEFNEVYFRSLLK